MRYTLFGRSGLRVSELCLGTMTFGEDWGWGASKEESRRIFDRYVEAGGNFVDTSSNYTNGTAERFVGEFVASDRDHFVLATKYTLTDRPGDPNFGGNHRKNLLRSLEGSLTRLGTDRVDGGRDGRLVRHGAVASCAARRSDRRSHQRDAP